MFSNMLDLLMKERELVGDPPRYPNGETQQDHDDLTRNSKTASNTNRGRIRT